MGKYYLGTGNQQINFQVVDSTGVISDLNLSGLYLSITGKAADADKLDNFDSSFFRNAQNLTGIYTGQISGSIGNADTLDGLDSSYFLNGANITGTVSLSGTFTGYYTGAFSGTITHTDSITFHTGLGINPDPAELTWSDDVGTMQLGLQGGNIDLRVGLQNYEYVTNRNASTLSKGSVVYISGAQGNRPAVALALANADSTSAVTFGILAEDIASMANGYAITNGLLTNLNTTGFAEGAALYLSPTVSGAVISSKPQAPNHSVLVGFCVRSHASAGEILVKIQNGVELDELHDVRIISAQNNDIIRYNAPSGVWFNSNTLALNGTGSHYISGDLGIGTSAPTARLHIVGADKRQIISSTTDNAALVLGQWDGATNRIESSTRKLLITSYASGISLGVNGSENVHVSTSGNLGVGTLTPAWKVDVIGAASTDSYIRSLGGSGATKGGFIIGNNDGGAKNYGTLYWDNANNTAILRHEYSQGYLGLGAYNRTTDLVILASGGDVGINTTTPTAKLNVHKAFTQSGLYEAKTFSITTDNGTSNWTLGQIVGYVAAGVSNSASGFPGGLMFKTKAADSNAGESGVATRMVINAAGNVGIGTTDPTQKFYVSDGNVAIEYITGSVTYTPSALNTSPRLTLIGQYSTTDTYNFIRYWSGGSHDWSAGTVTRSSGVADYIFQSYNGSAHGERLRITAAGNVGIGTTSPTQKLYISTGGSNGGIVVDTGAGSTSAFIRLINSNQNWDVNTQTNNRFAIYDQTNSKQPFTIEPNTPSNTMWLAATGNVGIGTTSPTSLFTVQGSQSEIHIKHDATRAITIGNWDGTAQYIKSINLGVALTPFVLQASRFTFDTGNVGIGTTNPADLLNIQGTNKNIRVTNTAAYNASGTAYLGFNGYYNSSNADSWFARIVSGKENTTDGDTRGYLSIQTNNPSSGIADRVRITSDGNVGIGTTTPSYKLHVVGDARIGANGQRIWLYDDGNAHVHATSGPLWLNSDDASGIYINNQNNGNVVLTNGTGRVGIGTTTPGYKLHIGDNSATASAHMMLDGVFGNTTAASHARIYFSDTNFGIGAGGWASSGSDDDLYLWAYDGSGRDIRFAKTSDGTSAVNTANWTTNMIIKNDGSVGIGTTTPYDKLEVAGGIAATGYTTGNASQAHATLIGVNGGTSYLQAVDWGAEYKPLNIEGKTISLQTGTGSTSSRFYIDNSGNVGIGTTSPNQKLEIKGGNVRIDNRAAGSYSAPDLEFLSGDSSGSWNVFKIRYTKNATLDRLEFIDGGNSNAFVIANGGNVTALGNLAVNGTGTSTINNLSIAPTSGHVYLTGPNTAGKFITLQNGNATGGINFRDSAGNEVASYYQVTDAWTFSKNTTISGNLTVSQNLIVNGTTTTINSTVTTIDDPIITLGGDTAPTVDDNKDRGVEFRWHNGTAAKVGFFGFDDSTGYFTFIPDATNSSEVFSGTQGDIQASNFRGTLIGSLSNALTAGSYLTGSPTSSYNGSVATTFNVDATSANTANKVVARDGNGDFSARIITATTFSGALSGNSSTTTKLNVTDSRNAADTPETISMGIVADFKTNTTNSLSDGGTYNGVLTFRQYGSGTDWSGGRSHQLAFTDNDNIWHRSGTSTSWGTWYKIWHQNNDGAGSGLDADLLDGYNQDTANTANTIVRRDASGNFSAGVITGTRLEARNSGTTQIYIDSTNNGSKEIVFQNNGATTGYLWQASTYLGLGGGSGSNSLFVTTSNGNVGVGTTSPNAKLQIGGTTTGLLTVGTLTNDWGGVVAIGTTDGNGIILSKVNAANDSNRVLTLIRDDSTGATIAGYKPNGTSADIGFFIRANAKSYFNGGNVGIGNNDPYSSLSVKAQAVSWGEGILVDPASNGFSAIYFRTEANQNSSVTGTWALGKNSSAQTGGEILHVVKNGLTGGALHRVDAAQSWKTTGETCFGFNVGIGTTTPTAAKLQISSGGISTQDSTRTFAGTTFNSAIGSSDTRTLAFNGAGGSSVWWCDSGTPSFAIDSSGGTTSFWRYSSGWVARMALDANGFGVNTTSPGVKLTTRSGTNSLPATSGTAQNGAGLRVEGGDNAVIDIGANSVDTWIQATDKSALDNYYRLLLNPRGGNVGIGVTTNPAYKLDVAGDIRVSGNLRVSSANTTGNGIIFADDGDIVDLNDAYCSMRISYGLRIYSQGGGGTTQFQFATSQSGAPTYLNAGNVGIGTTTPSVKLHVVGSSILANNTSIDPDAYGNTTIAGNIADGGGWGVGAAIGGNNGTGKSWAIGVSGDLYFGYQNGSANDTMQTFMQVGTNRNLFFVPVSGNVGIGTITPGYKLEVNGSFAATTKSFVIKHPTKEGKKLRYGSLEGPENGVYVRGKTTSKVIELPDYWTKLVDPDSITVQLTPIGSHQKLYVEKIEDNKVYIANENLLAKSINCFFYILAERADVEKLQVEIDA